MAPDIAVDACLSGSVVSALALPQHLAPGLGLKGASTAWLVIFFIAWRLQRDDPWTVRILPRVQLGVPTSPAYGLSPSDPSVVVLHHALASWRIPRRCAVGDDLCSCYAFLLLIFAVRYSCKSPLLLGSDAPLAGRLSPQRETHPCTSASALGLFMIGNMLTSFVCLHVQMVLAVLAAYHCGGH